MKRRPSIVLPLLFLVTTIVLLVTPFIGPLRIDITESILGIWRDDWPLDSQILMMTRLPRVWIAAVAGAALALSGLIFQAVFRNDLAEPYSLGVANAAAVGALIAVHYFPLERVPILLPLTSFIFSLIAVGTIIGLAQSRRGISSPAAILLAGVMLGFFFGAMIMLLQYLADPFQTALMLRWLMGGLSVTSFSPPMVISGVLFLGFLAVLLYGNTLNALTLGDAAAHNLGVQVPRARRNLLLCAALLASCVVAYTGPIGFVGLVIPHLLRKILGGDHRILGPACLLGGATFLPLCDAFARTAFSPIELPVGIITAFLGSPFFLFLLMRTR